MNPEIQSAQLFYHGAGWAGAMAAECAAAQKSIHASALSMHTPTPNAAGDWPELYRAWCAAARRGVRVAIWLPAPTQIHPATKGNITAGRSASASGIEVHYIIGNRLLHAKTAVIDGTSIWVGSGNFTAAAAHFNHEAYLQAKCPHIAKQMIARWESLA